jgi:hypothetical protein
MYLSELPARLRELAADDREKARVEAERRYYTGCAVRLDLAAQLIQSAEPDPIRTLEQALRVIRSLQEYCRYRCYAAGSLSHCDCQACEMYRLLDVEIVPLVREMDREGVMVR